MNHIIESRLKKAGIRVNGDNAWDIKIHDKRFFDAVLYKQNMGAGESYMEGWWDCDRIDELFFRILRGHHESQFESPWLKIYNNLKCSLLNQQSRKKANEVANSHYNLNNKLYEHMLGKSMAYTCGYWKAANNLDDAQFAKYELICKKLYLKPNEKILEIGCGWGGLAKYIAEKYQCEVIAIDIGRGPVQFAKELCKNLPVTVYECDYRDKEIYNPKNIQFDKIVSIGVLEHVGYKNYKTLMELSHKQIKDNGIFLLHSIGGNISKKYCDPWIDKYIFPNGMLPSIKQLGKAFENNFLVEDLQNFGAYYEPTLLAWHKNLNDHWSQLTSFHNERFRRMMNYYLLSCAGAFRARTMQLWQFVLTKEGLLNGYNSIR